MRRHFEKQISTVYRGQSHATPSKEKDIAKLDEAYTASRVHFSIPGRRASTKQDKSEDYVIKGALLLPKIISRWWFHRAFERSSEQEYS